MLSDVLPPAIEPNSSILATTRIYRSPNIPTSGAKSAVCINADKALQVGRNPNSCERRVIANSNNGLRFRHEVASITPGESQFQRTIS